MRQCIGVIPQAMLLHSDTHFCFTLYTYDAAWFHVVSISEDSYMLDDIAKP